VTIDVLNTLRK